MKQLRHGVWFMFALAACGSSTTVPLPEVGAEIGNVHLESGNKVAGGRVDKVEGMRVLVIHTWDGTEDWVDWTKVTSVEK